MRDWIKTCFTGNKAKKIIGVNSFFIDENFIIT